MGPLITLFWTSGDVCLVFQSQGRSLACFLACVILRLTSGVTPADCIEVSIAAKPFQSTYLQTCPQALVEVRGLNHDHLCGKHSAVCHSATPAQLLILSIYIFFPHTIQIWSEHRSGCVLGLAVRSTSLHVVIYYFFNRWSCVAKLSTQLPIQQYGIRH